MNRTRTLMDWKLFAGSFTLIFLAELGDKTQLAALGMVKNPADRWVVFAGAVTALAASTLIAVLAGGWLSARIPPFWFKCAAGVLFLGFGLFSLREAFLPKPADAETKTEDAPAAAPVQTNAAASTSARRRAREGVLGAILDWPVRVALDAAVAFEEAAAARYHRLAGENIRPVLRKLLTQLAADEAEHLKALRELAGAHGDVPLPGTPPAAPAARLDDDLEKSLDELARRSAPSADERGAVAALVAHETATADFYAALAERARLEPLRVEFARLSRAERRHAERLRAAFAAEADIPSPL